MFEINPSSICCHITICIERRKYQASFPERRKNPAYSSNSKKAVHYNNTKIDTDSLSLIFSLLNIHDLGRVAQVCKRWNKLSSDDRIWKRFQCFRLHVPIPYKANVELLVRSLMFTYLTKVKEIPEDLPPYVAPIVPADVSSIQYWEKKGVFTKESDPCLKFNIKKIHNKKKVQNLFKIVTKAFRVYIGFLCVGLTKIKDAENLAKKTKITFHNPYPFRILEHHYLKLGNTAKALEMKKIANDLKDPPEKPEPIIYFFPLPFLQ